MRFCALNEYNLIKKTLKLGFKKQKREKNSPLSKLPTT